MQWVSLRVRWLCYLYSYIDGKLRDDRRVEDPPSPSGASHPTVLLLPSSIITNSVWSRKYLGLYDFETQESTRRKLRV